VKVHSGIEGNNVADTLAKDAVQDKQDGIYIYNRIPISTIPSRVKEEGLKKWQAQWVKAVNGAICRLFFPKVEQRLKLRIPITPQFTAIVSGQGKTKAYLNTFKLIDNPICTCNEGEQSVEHLIYVCSILEPNLKRHDKT